MKYTFFLLFFITLGAVLAQEKKNTDSQFELMPWPQEVSENNSDFVIEENFSIYVHNKNSTSSRIFKAGTRFIRYMTNSSGTFLAAGFPNPKGIDPSQASLNIYFKEDAIVDMNMDESYRLHVDEKGIEIHANTDIGAMHGLSTLLQLMTVTNGHYVFKGADVRDEPRFTWRGLMMDVARHFMPVEVVKRNLDAMALVKLNVFHWHLSDDQGFRVETKTLPELYQLASDGQYYTQDQIRDIVKYADERGIRVVPEFDVPGHATAFLTAYPSLGSKAGIKYSLERNAGVFDPTLDPTNEKTYEFLDKLFKEVTPLFPDVYFHIGGDENAGRHWNENSQIQAFMKEHQLANNHELQTYFNIRLEKILRKYGKILMGWEEIMTPDMPKTALIHSWRGVNEGMEPGESLVAAVKNGYQTILSNGYYIDLMLSVKEHYLTDPVPDKPLTQEERKRILGGEATMWSELVTPRTVDSRIWPRTAAIAERFWSAGKVRDLDSMYERLERISQLLELSGIRHIQEKEYILRNISNYQDTGALNRLSEVSEPYKIYSRNAGGKQYQSYSPFTLFADACTPDAITVRPFEKAVAQFTTNKDPDARNTILEYLKNWSVIDQDLAKIEPQAPLISRIRPYAKRVSAISYLMEKGMQKGHLSKEEVQELREWMKKKEDPEVNLDVELAVSEAIFELAGYLQK